MYAGVFDNVELARQAILKVIGDDKYEKHGGDGHETYSVGERRDGYSYTIEPVTLNELTHRPFWKDS